MGSMTTKPGLQGVLDAAGNPVAVAGVGGTAVSVQTAADKVVRRIAATIAAARGNSSVEKPPLCQAPTWAISTAYTGGQTVRGTGSDAGNLYLCAGTATNYGLQATAGTSASSGTGPTGQGTGIQTDGTCKWIYAGPANATSSMAAYSTATLTGPSDAMNGALQFVPTTLAATIGLSTQTNTSDANPLFHLTGGVVTGRLVAPSNAGTLAVPSYTDSNRRNVATICTNARKWIAIRPAAALYQNSVLYDIEINGLRLAETAFLQSGALINPGMILLNLSMFGEGVKTIRFFYKQHTYNSLGYAIYTAADDFVWVPANANRWRLAFEGDSITQGGYFGQVLPGMHIESMVARQVGCDEYFNNAQGGTGAISTNGGAKTTYLQRLPDLVAFAPDVVCIGGFHNDVGNSGLYTSATRQAAFLSYFQALRSSLPNALVLVMPVQLLQGDTLTSGGATSMYDVETDSLAAFNTWNDSNSKFVPMLTATPSRITNAQGRHYQNTGTAPYNDSHPIPFYYSYIKDVWTDAIRAFVASK